MLVRREVFKTEAGSFTFVRITLLLSIMYARVVVFSRKKIVNMGNTINGNANNNSQKKVRKLTDDEISYYETKTLFTGHEILQLHKAFRRYCSSDASVGREQFVDMFSNYNKSAKALLFLDHVFRTWDWENNGNLSE